MSKKVNYTKSSISAKYVSLNGYKKVQLDKGKDELIIKDDGFQDVYWAREKDPNYQRAVEAYEEDQERYAKSFHPTYKNMTNPKDVSLSTFCAYFNKDWKASKTECFPVFSPYFKHGAPSAKKVDAYDDFCRARVRIVPHFTLLLPSVLLKMF